jgi:hypothetical protein
MNPLIGFTLPHAEQASLHHLQGIGLQVSQQEEEPIFWRRQRAILVHTKPARRPGFPIETPRGHMGLKRRLERGDQPLKLVACYTRQIQELCGASLHVAELYTGHPWGLLS